MNETVVELLMGAFVVTLIVTMVSFVNWAGGTDMVHPEDVNKATAVCELNEGWKTVEVHTRTNRTVICNNGGVFTFDRDAK